MHSFAYKNGTLYCENVNLQELADKESTPLYVYSKQTILNHFHRLREALAPLNAEVAYAVKAGSNIAILNLMARNGAGFDIVSGGELFRVLKAGGDPSKCTYAGVGKTEQEIRYALAQGIYCFNVESEAELRAINAIAASMGVKAPVAVRVNPTVGRERTNTLLRARLKINSAWTSNALNLFMRWRPANFRTFI